MSLVTSSLKKTSSHLPPTKAETPDGNIENLTDLFKQYIIDDLLNRLDKRGKQISGKQQKIKVKYYITQDYERTDNKLFVKAAKKSNFPGFKADGYLDACQEEKQTIRLIGEKTAAKVCGDLTSLQETDKRIQSINIKQGKHMGPTPALQSIGNILIGYQVKVKLT